MIHVITVAATIRQGRYRLGHETLLQDDVEAQLRRAGLPYEREKQLGPNERPDFLVDGRIAVELKVKGGKRAIYRQLERYAAHDVVDSLILVTLVPSGLPPAIDGKPLHVVNLALCCL